jgi:hydroxymethylpyrimidine/phosphomethylpyrimidine kinase
MTASRSVRAIALTLAGSDCSGGAGIQADLKTFAAFQVYGAAVLTALTAQNTHGVTGVLAVPPDFIAKQISAVVSDLNVGAVKTGMLGDRATVDAVADAVERHGLMPLVVDPVMVATSGDVLLAPDAVDAVRQRLAPLATVLTPNLLEAAHLTGEEPAQSQADMQRQGEKLLSLGAKSVLVKGGHLSGDSTDLLVTSNGTRAFTAVRLDTRNTHGTGCSLSAAIAACLARGHDVPASVERAKDFVWHALQAGRDLGVGSGNGPLDHLVAPENGDWGR